MKKKLLCIFLTIIILNGYSVTGFAAYENTHVNTGNQAEDLLAVAMTQSGYMEGSLEGTVQGSNNYTKYGVWWTDATNWGVDYSHSAWCSMFVSWCAWQADIPASVLYRTAGCDEGVKKAKERNTWHFSPANGGNYTPKRGDLIYFGTLSDSNHVGIVRSVSGTKVYTIEGNSSNKVNQVSYSLTSSSILGYSSPAYTDTSSGSPHSSALIDKLEKADKHYCDVSKWQGTVDWSSAAADVDGVIIRIGYRASSSRSLIIDPYFLSNYTGAKAAGLDVGCYFYSDALTNADAVEEADWIAEKLASYGCRMELPVFLDIESSSMQSLSKSALTGIARAFCDEMLVQDYLPGIYVSKSWAVSEINLSAVEDCAIWIAQYNTSCTYTGHYDMWQYTDKGSVSGISGGVDLNHCYVNYKKYIMSNGLNGFDKTSEEPQEHQFPQNETYLITNPDGAQVFSDNTASAAVAGSLPYNYQVYVYETDETFGRIIYGTEESYISLADAVPLSSTYTLGEGLGTYKVTASALNIRSGPSTSYTSLGTLPEGTEVEITALSGIWCRFSYNGSDAWLSSNYLEYISKTVLDSNKGTGESVVIRSAPGETFTLPACPYERPSYTFEGWSASADGEQSVTDSASLTAEKSVRVLYAVWKEAQQETHYDGETYIVTAASTLNVRTGPGTRYDKIGTLTNGTQIYVYETSGTWGRIIYGGEDAWISSNYISPVSEAVIFAEGCGFYQVTASSLTVRAGAGTGYSALGYLGNSDTVKALGRSGIWAKIDFGGKEGWVSTAYMQKLNIVQFDSNKGTGADMFVTAPDSTQITLPENHFIRDNYTFEGWSDEKDGEVKYSDKDAFTVNGNTILYAVWRSDEIFIQPAENSETIVNENNFTVSGIKPGMTSDGILENCIYAESGISLSVNAQRPGTGSLITAERNGKTKNYTIVIYGDIDGDGLADARDAVLAQAYINNYLTFMDLPVGAYWAIDADNDYAVTDSDCSLMLSSGLLLCEIAQTR